MRITEDSELVHKRQHGSACSFSIFMCRMNVKTEYPVFNVVTSEPESCTWSLEEGHLIYPINGRLHHCQGSIKHASPSAREPPGKVSPAPQFCCYSYHWWKEHTHIIRTAGFQSRFTLFHLWLLMARKGWEGKKMKERLPQNATFCICWYGT